MHEKCLLLSSEVLLMEYCIQLRSIDRLSLIRVTSAHFTGSLLTRVKHHTVKHCLGLRRFLGIRVKRFLG